MSLFGERSKAVAALIANFDTFMERVKSIEADVRVQRQRSDTLEQENRLLKIQVDANKVDIARYISQLASTIDMVSDLKEQMQKIQAEQKNVELRVEMAMIKALRNSGVADTHSSGFESKVFLSPPSEAD